MERTAPKESSLTTQSAWILSAKVAGFVLNTVLPLLVVRYLSREDVGIYRQAFLIASNAVLVLPLGFSMSAFYFLNRDPEKHAATVFNILVFNFLMGAAAFGFLYSFPQVIGAAFQSPELERLAPAIGVVIWLWIFSGFLETAALALQEARLAAIFIILFQLFKTFFMIVGVVYSQTVDSLIYAAVVIFAIQSIVLLVYINDRFPSFWRRGDLQFFGRQLAYALPFGFSVLLYVVQTDTHNYFVSHSFSAADFAIYSVGCFQLPLVAMLYESVGSVMIPRMSQLQDEDRKRDMLETSVVATQRLAFVYFPLFAFLIIVAEEFITTLFTQQYAASADIFRINLLVLPLFSLVVDPITRAYPRAGRRLLNIRVAICVLLLLIFWMGMGRFGLTEMISIVVAAIFIEKLACAWISARMLDATVPDLRLFAPTARIALATTLAAAFLGAVYVAAGELLLSASLGAGQSVIGLFGQQSGSEFLGGCIFLSICLAVFLPVYLLAANLAGGIDDADRMRIRRLARRVMPGRSAG